MNQKFYSYLVAGVCALVLSAGSVNAQFPCGTDQAMLELFRKHPELQAEHEQLLKNSRNNLQNFKNQNPSVQSGSPMIIPIVFHIIHQYGSENIADSQVQDQVDILNRDFRKKNADTATVVPSFQNLIADTDIEFRLATKDPDGNCTNGIERYFSYTTNSGSDNSKLDPWPRDKYLNIWVVKTMANPGTAGYAYYPSSVTGIMYIYDGIILLHDYIGSIGTGTAFTSRALAHEIGHYLNLSHTWGSNNNASVDCGDDGIPDTPLTEGNLDCSLRLTDTLCNNSEPKLANVENYMEYSYCSKMFTPDQGSAMAQTLSSAVSYRSSLWTYQTHLATGTDSVSIPLPNVGDYQFPQIIPSLPLCVPVADFTANRYYVCQGGTVIFTDRSWRAAVTSRTWTFPNGTPSTSTVAAPTVTFSTWGWQTVTLTATNSTGSDTKTWTNCVFVSPPWYDYFGAFSEGFENNNFANGYWIVESMENSYPQWQQTSQTAYTGSNCVKLNAYGTNKGLTDAFITPSFNLSTSTGASLNFMYSCATSSTLSTDITEVLRIYSTTNCGQSWNLRSAMNGTILTNAGYSANGFLPNSQSLWASKNLALTSADLQPNVRFKIEYTSGGYSNNIYIDDINITATVGVNDVENYFFGLNIYPNPTNGDNQVNVSYTLVSQEKITISLMDVIGRETVVISNEVQNAGDKIVTLDKNALNLNAGVYLVKISNGTSYSTRKLIITN